MFKRFTFLVIVASFGLISSLALADKRGVGDRTITDHSRVNIHQRYPGDAERQKSGAAPRYREKCHWYFKRKDGWWWTQATQRCVRVRVN